MITRVVLTLEAMDGKIPNIFWAYNLYAELLKKAEPGFAEYLHETGLKPLSQYLRPQKNTPRAQWVVNLLTDEAAEIFLPALLEPDEFFVEKQNCVLKVIEKRADKKTSEDELLKQHYFEEEPQARVQINLLTPCAFKTEGGYAVFPSPALIINSAVNKWNSFAQNTAISDEEGTAQLVDSAKITGYNLRSFRYQIKGVQIPSFSGYMTLSVRGPAPMLRLFNLLMGSAEYTGLGIKCALGMGAVQTDGKVE